MTERFIAGVRRHAQANQFDWSAYEFAMRHELRRIEDDRVLWFLAGANLLLWAIR